MKTKDKYHKMSIEGIFNSDKIQLAMKCSAKIKAALNNLQGIEVNIFCRA